MSADASRRALATLHRFGRPHRRVLAIGVLGSAGWVAFRLAMPWPLRGVVELVFAETGEGKHGGHTVLSHLPDVGPPLAWLLGGYVAVIGLLGVAELVQRLHMGSFASRTMRDLRAAATHAVRASGGGLGHGELVVRLVSDVARVKSDLKGILVHATQNSLLFLSICVLFAVLSPLMGLFLVVGGAVTIAIGFFAARRAGLIAEQQRTREGHFAAALVDGLESGESPAGARTRETRKGADEGNAARVVTAASLLTHLALALTVAAALAVGVSEVRSGALHAGELFLFIAYALMVHRRLIQLGRQLVRAGKLRANLDRLAALLDAPPRPAAPSPLEVSVRLAGVEVASDRASRARLAALDLEIAARSRVALVGKAGAGKSTFLRLLAGLVAPTQGAITWDERPYGEVPDASVAYLAQAPHLAARPLWEIFGLAGPEVVPPAQLRALEEVGAWAVVRRLTRGLRQVVSSRTLAAGETRAIAAGRVALGDASLWLLDALDESKARAAALLARAEGRTVVAAFTRLRQPERFTRVIALKRGRVEFDGTPAEWRAWRGSGRRRARAAGGAS